MEQDSKVKILNDWNKRDYNGVEKPIITPIFRSFDALFRYLKNQGKWQGKKGRFELHPYDNLHEYKNDTRESTQIELKREKLEERRSVNKHLAFLKRIKDFNRLREK